MPTMKAVTLLIAITALLLSSHSCAQELSATPKTSEAKTWTFNAGIGSPKAWNFAGITREFLLDDHTAFFVTGGLGTALVGVGVAYYDNRSGNGIVASSAIGVVDLQATLAYQVKIAPQDFVAVGGAYGLFFMQCACWLPVLSYEHRY